ncbi:MAG: hypothetical protein MK212_17305, partial [Saprospiraceae bacterium]|nr:hypothetical protein [Saprospiraceae bacterium]
KVEPLPNLLRTDIVPWCSSTICLTIDKPSPVPPVLLWLESSTCLKLLKTRPKFSSAIPIPVSYTSKRIQ